MGQQLTGLQHWTKDIYDQLRSLTEQVKITNGKVMKNKEDIALIKQANLLRKEFQEKAKLMQKVESGQKMKVGEHIDKLELLPPRFRYPLFLLIALVLLKVLDKGGDMIFDMIVILLQ